MAVERELEKSDSLKYVNPGVVIHLSITIYIAMKSGSLSTFQSNK